MPGMHAWATLPLSLLSTQHLQRPPPAIACPQILDVASASGEPAVSLARALPQASVVASDFAEPFLQLGRCVAAASAQPQRSEQPASGLHSGSACLPYSNRCRSCCLQGTCRRRWGGQRRVLCGRCRGHEAAV